MKKIILAMALASAASAASAASTLTSVSVNGPSGTVWNTAVDGYYTVFLQNPFGNVLNPNDNFSGFTPAEGANNFLIAGEGYYPGTSVNSDPFYTIFLNFADGAQISGTYSFLPEVGGGFLAGPNSSATVGNTTYTLTGFGWDRSRANNVGAYSVNATGSDPFDYTGQFAFSAVSGAVPEPATWALFILGFGAIGASMRARSARATSAKASMTFA